MNTCSMTVTVTVMYMYIHACACVHVYTCVWIICACVRACVRTCVTACVHAGVRECVSACTSACVRACMRTSIRLFVLMHASRCIFHSSDKYLTARRRVWNVILTGWLNLQLQMLRRPVLRQAMQSS